MKGKDAEESNGRDRQDTLKDIITDIVDTRLNWPKGNFVKNLLNNDILQIKRNVHPNECTTTVDWHQMPANQLAIGRMALKYVENGSLPNAGASRGHFGRVS